MSKSVQTLLLGCVLGVAAVGLGALLIIETGAFDATASKPHAYPVAWATHTAMVRSIELRSRDIAAPPRFTPDDVRQGMRLYDHSCAMCHGGPATGRSLMAAGLNPDPPYLLDAARHWTAPQLFRIVHDGVKMTGMPAWRGVYADRDIWRIVAFLEAMPAMAPDAYLKMRAANAAPAPPPAAAGASR